MLPFSARILPFSASKMQSRLAEVGHSIWAGRLPDPTALRSSSGAPLGDDRGGYRGFSSAPPAGFRHSVHRTPRRSITEMWVFQEKSIVSFFRNTGWNTRRREVTCRAATGFQNTRWSYLCHAAAEEPTFLPRAHPICRRVKVPVQACFGLWLRSNELDF